MDALELSNMLRIAAFALERERCDENLKAAKENLRDAYKDWRADNGFAEGGLQRDSSEWQKMLFDTQVDYALVKSARQASYNAKRRFSNAIRRHVAGMNGGGENA